MYEAGRKDRAFAIEGHPLPRPGATQPLLLASEGSAVLMYWIAEEWLATVGLAGSDRIAICTFQAPRATFFGPPNDEGLDSHPLYGRGLGFYGVFRVEPSAWVDQLRNVSRRRDALPVTTIGRTHFIVTMQDSTFECVASDLTFETQPGPMEQAVSHMVPSIR